MECLECEAGKQRLSGYDDCTLNSTQMALRAKAFTGQRLHMKVSRLHSSLCRSTAPHLIQYPDCADHIVKAPQVSGPAGGQVVGRHIHAKLRVVMRGIDGAGCTAVDVCIFTPAQHMEGGGRHAAESGSGRSGQCLGQCDRRLCLYTGTAQAVAKQATRQLHSI